MASTKRTWISIVIASVIIVAVLALAVVGGTAFFIYRHVDATFTNETTAQQEFATARARFAGQQALIEITKNEEPVVRADVLKNAKMPDKPLETLRVIAYDDSAGKLVRVSIPFWLLRLLPSNHLSFLNDEGIELDTRRIHLTIEDLERRGPGLVLDSRDRRGSQVIVWTE
jgi:hypothetical protein